MDFVEENSETACPHCDYRMGYYVIEGEGDIGDMVRCPNCARTFRLTYGCFKPIKSRDAVS